MSSFAVSTPVTSTPPASDASGVACFSVHARAEPGVMPRVLELFAKRGLVPSTWHSSVSADLSELAIDIQMGGMAGELADYVAACLRQIADVEVVLTSRKHY
jgi:hypothetical protein